MTFDVSPVQQPLFDLPPEQVRAVAAQAKPLAIPRDFNVIRHRLWIDLDVLPSPVWSRMPPAFRGIRDRLKTAFDGWDTSRGFSSRTHDAGQQLLWRLRRVSYTAALVAGSFRIYVEYRDCDKFPHYRLMWGHLLWGRIDIRIDTNIHGPNIQARSTLPQIQDRLADYLVALGYRAGAHLQPHEPDIEDEDAGDVLYDRDAKTTTREYRLFRFDADNERRAQTQNQKSKEFA